MLSELNYTVSEKLLQQLREQPIKEEFRYAINKPTGRFFYDPWVIKEEYKDTVWASILETLPVSHGEARIINLKPGTCYHCHSDIDDRYHLNINGENAYLVDLDNTQLHPLVQDGKWYEMDASRIHSAVNFGRVDRLQLVIRKLLTENNLVDPVKIQLTTTLENKDKARFIFDQSVSNWLNHANKESKITEFSHNDGTVRFKIERTELVNLQSRLPNIFDLEIL